MEIQNITGSHMHQNAKPLEILILPSPTPIYSLMNTNEIISKDTVYSTPKKLHSVSSP